jgi:hypothetical protein
MKAVILVFAFILVGVYSVPQNPVIGIYTQNIKAGLNGTYIAASYVKYL